MAQESSILIEVSDNGTTWTTLTTKAAGTTSHSHTGLTAGTSKFYRVKAVGDGATTTDSAWATTSATTAGGTGTALTAPTLTAAPSNSVEQAMRLNWTNVANNSGYLIEYSTDNATWQTLGSVAAGVVTYLHESLTVDTLYHYRVIALWAGSYSNSAPSAVVSSRTYRYIETYEFTTIDETQWTVTNPNPTAVTFGIESGQLKMHMPGGGTTSSSVANNIKSAGAWSFPLTVEARMSVVNEAATGVHRFSLIADGGDHFSVARGIGSGSTPSGVTLELVTGGVSRHSVYYGEFNWKLVKGIRWVFRSSTDYELLMSNDLTTWAKVGLTFTHDFTGPVRFRLSSNESSTVKTVFVDTLTVASV